jgi:hypothetical protein
MAHRYAASPLDDRPPPPESDQSPAIPITPTLRRGGRQTQLREVPSPPASRPSSTALEVPDCAREVLSRGRIPERLLPPGQVFQATQLSAPVLPTAKKSVAKLALECFKLILTFTKAPVSKKTETSAAVKLLKNCASSPELRDEVYFQLLKQTVKNDTEPYRMRTWELLLIVASTIPASGDVEVHLARCATQAEDAQVRNFARLALIRCAVAGEPAEDVSPAAVDAIPKEIDRKYGVFETSVYEQLFAQRAEFPKLPIPFLVYLITRVIVEKNGLTWEGVFRRSGDLTVVQDTVKAINRGENPQTVLGVQKVRVNELCQLLKLWFSTLPQRIVSSENVTKLRRIAHTSKDFVGFAESELPIAYRFVLKFVCGLLQQIAKNEATTKMNTKNIARVFGPSVVTNIVSSDPMELTVVARIGQDFITGLLENWDTQDIYPMPPQLLAN